MALAGRVRQGRFPFRFLPGRTGPAPPVTSPLGVNAASEALDEKTLCSFSFPAHGATCLLC
jgi:hypothetical protein